MGRPRKKSAWNDAEGQDMDTLAAALRGMSGEKLRALLKRDKTFTFRLSEMDRETMDRAAKAVDIPVAEYIIRLHYIAYEALQKAGVVE